MNEIPTRFERIVYACAAVYARKWIYIIYIIIIFSITAISLASVGIIPDYPLNSSSTKSIKPVITLTSVSVHDTPAKIFIENPVKISMPSIHKSASIKNPDTQDVRVLNKALLSGAVRYWHSAKLGEKGNIVLFGHSSYIPIILNQAYKTFSGIQNLHRGASIFVYSTTTVYEYAVDTVKKQNTTTDSVNLLKPGKNLTLITCNVFGKKSDRFVVSAHFVKSYPIGNNS